jgi:PleD family two-component response regulator
VSIGVTTTEGRLDSDWDALHVRADEALYAAKSAGRNRAMSWNAPA